MTDTTLSFEEFGHENGMRYWWASDFMLFLGYKNMSTFRKVVGRARTACLSANIEPGKDIIPEVQIVDGKKINDFKLTRFGCYMVAMSGDPRKAEVGTAQAYFATVTERINLLLEGAEDPERLIARDKIKEGNILLSSQASASGVTNFALFHDAGYRGLYNGGVKQVAAKKGVDSRKFIDHMGRIELAANFFRITLTEEQLKLRGRIGQRRSENVHKEVGAQVRGLVKKNTGKFPEELPLERRLGDVKKELKRAHKSLNKAKREDLEDS